MITVEYAPNELGYVKNLIAYRLSSNLIFERNLQIAIQVFAETALYQNDFRLIYETSAPVSADNAAEFYLEDVLEAELQYDLPNISNTAPQTASQVCKRYYIAYAERAQDDALPFGNFVNNATAGLYFTFFRPMLAGKTYRFTVNSSTSFEMNIRNTQQGTIAFFTRSGNFTEVAPGVWQMDYTPATNFLEVFLEAGLPLNIIESPIVFQNHATKFALLGGEGADVFPFRDFPLPNNRKTLSNADILRFVTSAQVAHLYYFPLQNGALTVSYTITYDDQTTYTFTENVGAVRKFEAVILAVGMEQKDYAQYNQEKRIYQVRISEGAETLAILQLIRHPEDFDTELHFFNSLGGLFSVVASGQRSTSLRTERLTTRKYKAYNYTPAQGEYTTMPLRTEKQHTLHVGHQERQVDYRALLDLLVISEAYLRVGTRFVKVEIETAEQLENADRNFLPEFVLSYKTSLDFNALTV